MPTYTATQRTVIDCRSGSQSQLTSPSKSSTLESATNTRSTIQLLGSTSTNTSPTSTYQQQSTMSNQSSSGGSGSSSGALNPFLAHYAPPRQLHPPKSPLYRPAVLRTTERPIRSAQSSNAMNGATQASSSSSSINSDGKDGSSSLNILGGSVIGNVFGSGGLKSVPEWEEVMEKPVTGPPTRAHWKDDSLSMTCDSVLCAKNFTLFERRHHCRKCGQIFCAEHSSHYVKLDQDCEFHPQGTRVRTCDNCFEDYKSLVAQRRASSASVSDSNNVNNTASSPIVHAGKGRSADAFGTKAVGSYVGSVPRDWSWSTF